jgi:hypothetical protein
MTPLGLCRIALHSPLKIKKTKLFNSYVKASLFSSESLIFLRLRQNCLRKESRKLEIFWGSIMAKRPMHIEIFCARDLFN